MYPACLPAAYLAQGNGRPAAARFQKFLDHTGIVQVIETFPTQV